MNDVFYTYTHSDPLTQEVVYVGKGKYGRAWDVTRARSTNHQHSSWLKDMSSLGFIPTDWVCIIDKNLSEKDALYLEKQTLYRLGGTRFNGQSGEDNYQAKLTNEQAREIYTRSFSEKVIALSKEFGVSKAAIYHIKKGTQWQAATSSIRN